MKKIIEYLIVKIKRRDFKFDENVSDLYILSLSLNKAICFLRGVFLYRKPIFLGKASKIYCPNKLFISSSSIEIGNWCKLDCSSSSGLTLGENFKLGDFSKLIVSGTIRDLGKGITIGDNVAVGEYSYIGGAGGVVIGDDCIIGQYFSVHPENHSYQEMSVLIREQGVRRQGISIGNNCWIGAKVTICDGVTIGDNCVIAAGSVVTKSFGNNSLLGGVPARYIKNTYE